mmetsp:Transcript_71811/g.191679  ORF Transcript_71811/g.191679 Transcript_71811/m.191679 type:complete len:150 (+) Transcript_71811:426-875(+)
MAFSVLNVVDENLFPFAASASDCVVSIPKPPPARRVAESVLHCVSEPCFAPHAPAPHLGTTKLPRTVSSIQLPGPVRQHREQLDESPTINLLASSFASKTISALGQYTHKHFAILQLKPKIRAVFRIVADISYSASKDCFKEFGQIFQK